MPGLQANEKLRKEMDDLKTSLKSANPSSGSTPASTSARKAKACKPTGKAKAASPPDGDDAGSDGGGDLSGDESQKLSEPAKLARLRRLCERKASGKLHVPQQIHDMWSKGGHSRLDLLAKLEDANFDKDCSICFPVQTTSFKNNLTAPTWFAGVIHLDSDPKQRDGF